MSVSLECLTASLNTKIPTISKFYINGTTIKISCTPKNENTILIKFSLIENTFVNMVFTDSDIKISKISSTLLSLITSKDTVSFRMHILPRSDALKAQQNLHLPHSEILIYTNPSQILTNDFKFKESIKFQREHRCQIDSDYSEGEKREQMREIGLKICVLAFLMVIVNAKVKETEPNKFPIPQILNETDHHVILQNITITELPEHHRNISSINLSPEKQLNDAIALTNAIKTMLKVLKHTYFVDSEVNELLKASRTFGLLFQESFSKGLESKPEMQALEDIKQKLLIEMCEDSFQFMKVPDNEDSFVEENIVGPINALQNRIHQVLQNFTNKNLKQLESKCQSSNPFIIAKLADAKLNSLIAEFVDRNTPQKDDYLDLKKVYTEAYKKLVAFYSICNAFLDQSVTSNTNKTVNDTKLFAFVRNINKKFTKSYWTTKRITNDMKIQIKIGGKISDISFNIYDELKDEYKDFGYTYHVGVSGEDRNYNNATLIYCLTECQYLSDYKGFNVQVLRNIIKQDGSQYQACEFLNSLQNEEEAKKWCTSHKKTYGDLRDLGDEIIEKCNPPAFSIAVNRADYRSNFDKKTKAFFDHQYELPCYGNVYIAAVNKPLP